MEWLEERMILKVYRGSHAYGLATEESDVDIGGIFVPPVDYIVGLKKIETYNGKNYINYPSYNLYRKEAEISAYELRKYVYLAYNCNPNIIEFLFTDPQHIIFCNEVGRELIKHRYLFLSKKVKQTFAGYAYSQLKKMDNKTNHNHHGAHRSLIEKYGYDTKHAMHLIRLLRMGIEILRHGECIVLRPDRDYLLSIKYGHFSLDEIKQEAEKLFRELDNAYSESKLPDVPDFEKVNSLLCGLMLNSLWTEMGSMIQKGV